MIGISKAVRVGAMGLLGAACTLLGGCVAVDASRDEGPTVEQSADAAPVRVELLVVAVDGRRFANTTDARWLQSFLTNEARDVDIQRSETADLLGEAKRRLGTAPGFEFMRTHQVTVLAGSSAMASVLMGTGSEMQIWTRPRLVRDGLYEVSPRVELLHKQASGDGLISGVSYRAPALRYGTVPLTVPAGGARAVRMRREMGTPIRPEDLQIFLFAEVAPAG
jgi:hypothetical protein